MTGAVGMITSPVQEVHIIRTEQADAVIMGREFLHDPYWALRAPRELDQRIAWPVQYLSAAPKGAQPRVPVDLKSFESCFEEQMRFRNSEVPLSNALFCGRARARQASSVGLRHDDSSSERRDGAVITSNAHADYTFGGRP